MNFNITVWALSLILPATSVAQASNHVVPEQEMITHAPTTLPIRLFRQYLVVVEGAIGERTGLNFLIDTGADPSVVSRQLARELNLAETQGKLELLNRTMTVTRVLLPDLRVGPVQKQSLPVLVNDLTFLERGLGVRIDAVIGLDALSVSGFKLDYRARKITFGSQAESCSHGVPIQMRPPFVIVPMTVRGFQFRFLIDTGASGLLLFQSRVQDVLPDVPKGKVLTSSNMAGNFQLTEILLPASRLGKVNLTALQAFLLNDRNDVGRDFDGLMGMAALAPAEISLDFQHSMFCWKK